MEASPDYLKLMARRLLKENHEYVSQALLSLSERKREEGETALLDLATILEEIRFLTPRPKTAYEIERDEIFAEQKASRERIQ